MSGLAWLGFLAAAAVGAPARVLVDSVVHARWPGGLGKGTFVVNTTGSLLLGVVTGLGLYHGLSADVRVAIGTGGLGAYTTFSTLTSETVHLIDTGEVEAAMRNALGSVIVCLLAASLGLAITAAL
jgi:CrcB protein